MIEQLTQSEIEARVLELLTQRTALQRSIRPTIESIDEISRQLKRYAEQWDALRDSHANQAA